MQDLARAAGMSVGNFYRYFPSKAAIVQAMCGYDLAEIGASSPKSRPRKIRWCPCATGSWITFQKSR